MASRRSKQEKGFTLIELLVVIVIVGGVIFGVRSCQKNNSPQSPEVSQQEPKCADVDCTKKTILEATNYLDQLKSEKEKLRDLTRQYGSEYENYRQHLVSQVNDNRNIISSHEELLRKCSENIKLCNLLDKVTILKYSLNWLQSKTNKVDFRIEELDHNIWKLNKKLELGEVASSEEQNKINEIITSVKAILENQISPPEAQDKAKLQQDLFNEVISSKKTNLR